MLVKMSMSLVSPWLFCFYRPAPSCAHVPLATKPLAMTTPTPLPDAFAPGAPARHIMIDARYVRERSSGIGRYTEHVISHMLRLAPGLHLHLITHPSRPRPFDHPRVTTEVFAAAPNSPLTITHLSRRIDTSRAELFHSPFNLLPAGLPLPAVFTLHDIMWLIDPAFCAASRLGRLIQGTYYQAMIPRAVSWAKGIMTVSHASARAIESHFPHTVGKVHVTYNGVDPFFTPMPREEAARVLKPQLPGGAGRFVLVVGQGSPYKNHEGALEGFLEAFGHKPEVKLVLVRRFDRGTSPRMKRLLAHPSLQGRLVLLDYVTGQQLRALYSLATCFLFPSLYEGFGLPPLEAMACGTPVVTSDRGAPGEVCGGGAVLVDPDDPGAIGGALERLFEDQEYWEQVRERGLKHASGFGWERSARQVLQGYAMALGEERGGRW